MLKIIKQVSILALLTLILTFPYFVFGQEAYKGPTMKGALEGLGGASGYETSGISETSVSAIAGTAVSVFLSILGIIFIALILYGGYLWMMARGNDEQLTRAKELITSAVIGLIIVVAAYAASYFIFDRLTRQTLTTPAGSGGCPPGQVDYGQGCITPGT
ncbi:MAG: pilin [Patescibacteria group bacterium]|nr:pilin [Patescibacteria group bacterium]